MSVHRSTGDPLFDMCDLLTMLDIPYNYLEWNSICEYLQCEYRLACGMSDSQ